YDCSSADINPVGSISKQDLRRFLKWAATHLGFSSLANIEAAPPTAELEPNRSNYSQANYLTLHVSMFKNLCFGWGSKLSPSEVADKLNHFFKYYSINRHKMTVLTPSYHAESYSSEDNRFDLRQFLYNSRWPYQFRKIDELVDELSVGKGATTSNGVGVFAAGSANPKARRYKSKLTAVSSNSRVSSYAALKVTSLWWVLLGDFACKYGATSLKLSTFALGESENMLLCSIGSYACTSGIPYRRWQRTMEQLQQELAKLMETIIAMNTKIQALENRDHAGRINASGEPKPYLKLFFPRFSGEDPQGWVYQAKQYFEFQKVAEGDRIALASFHLDGIALQWHRWYTKAQEPVTWAEFTKALLVRFGPTDYEDPSEALHRLKQSTTVVIYQVIFERLSNRVEGLPESFLVGCFIGGLKDEIRLEVKLKKPRRLVEAMGMARLVEEKNNLARKPFTPNHNVSNPEETENENLTNDALETQADEVQGEISFHAISGTILPQTLRLPGRIQNKDVVVLVDGALLEFKSSLKDSAGVLSGWDLSSNSDHCSWIGVTCGSLDGRVYGINITGGGQFTCFKYDMYSFYGFGVRKKCDGNGFKLSGKLSVSISKLTELRVLSLPFNDLSGEIPDEIWGMDKLEVIDLEGNLISGSLPFRFSGLRSLRVLNLAFNKVSGEIPEGLSEVKSLQVLNLAGNRVNGSIPMFLDVFGDLRGLYLSFNLLSGDIPDEIGYNCGSLEHLELSGNLLFGGIPSSLGNCTKLQSLLLYSNLLQEEIPFELGRLKRLEVLDVSRNSLSGAIPRELGSCSNLSILVLSNLFNPIPSVYNTDDGVSQLAPEDEFNYFEGTIPSEITTLPMLQVLWAPRATLEGNFPENWGACASLEVVNLGQNLFVGEVSKGFDICKKLHFLDVSWNKLTGEISDKLRVPCMTVFDVSGNRLSGPIPSFRDTKCEPVNPSTTYLQYFASKSVINPLLFPNNAGDVAITHNFGGNNFTGGLVSLPIARTSEKTVYAFLAGQNELTGEFPGPLFEKCVNLKAMVFLNKSFQVTTWQVVVNQEHLGFTSMIPN
nr:LRR receptor-like serine/threonine-protein kinase RPK2 [Tanacetum cinerariifolium]